MDRESFMAFRGFLHEYFKDWTRWERGWLATFALISIVLFFVMDDSLLGLITSLTGMVTVVLVAKGRISNYYFGMVNVVLYAFLSYQSQFYGEVMLNIGYFLPMQFIGLYLWNRNRSDRHPDAVEVTALSTRRRLAWVGIAAVAITGYGFVLQHMGGNLPFLDSTSTVLSVIAQYLMVKRVVDQWYAWITIDVVSIYMWLFAYSEGHTIAMAVMWTAYLVNAIYGWWNWRDMAAGGTDA